MKFRLPAALASCAVAAGLIAGCGPKESTPEPSEPQSGSTTSKNPTTSAAPGGKKFKLAFVTNNASDFWTIARKGTEKADTELDNVEVEFKIPSDGTAAEQTRLVDDMLAKGIDGFAMSPVDPANETELINKAAAKVLVFTQDSDAAKSNRACYIGTDNRAAGKQAGELIKEALPNGGDIMVFVGKKDAQNAQDRFNGIKDALAGSKVKILDVRTDDTDHARAKSNAADTLVKYPNIAALVGLWSYNGPAIVSAVKEAKKQDKVKIVCFDEEADTLAGVKDGSIYGTIVQQPYEFGYQSIKAMEKYLSGDKSVVPADKKKIVPTLIIKQKDVDAFSAKLKQLRS